MNRLGTFTILLVLTSTSGCASPQFKDDEICSEIAAFANSVHGSELRRVILTTDWGGQFEPKQPGKDVIAAKYCEAFEYTHGETLCSYLVENTSTEFPEINVNRVLSCFGALGPNSNKSIEYGPTIIWSYASKGVKADARVGIEYAPGSESAAPTLKILAEGLGQF